MLGPRRHRWMPGVLLATALLAGGCTGGSDADDAEADATSASPSSDAAPTSGGGGPPDEEPAGDPLAGATFEVETTYSKVPATMRLDLIALERRGNLLRLKATLTNTNAPTEQDQRWQVGSRFGPTTQREDLDSTNGAFSGLLLTDQAEDKRHLVAADSSRNCVCTTDLSATFVDAGQSLELTATYAAPPESTTAMDVEVPDVRTFDDVPIS